MPRRTASSFPAATSSIAFLRGINVGGHRVKMEDLRAHFSALGFREVATFIASGNVSFTAPGSPETADLERRIEQHLLARLGFPAPVILRTREELAAVAAYRPFAEEDLANPAWSINVVFGREAPTAAARRVLAGLNGPKDAFHVHGREIYWLCRGKISIDSLAWPQLEKTSKGAEGTMRNLKTVRQLAALYPPAK